MKLNKLQTSAYRLAQASEGNPIVSTVVVIIFYLMANVVEFAIEKVFFGGPFVHFFDVILAICAIAYGAYSVYWCAAYNSLKD